ncbi:MAG: histidine ammonia-lyase [Defluviitaleaceae bacterium]|nr:histidine ammonia-lyase [Defluviitaleaceae bacterium]
MKEISIDGISLTLEDVVNVSRNGYRVSLSENAKTKVSHSRDYVEKLLQNEGVVYGITTGFGSLQDTVINKKDVQELQKNLIVSHACSVGNHLPKDVVRAMILLRANSLATGYSGIRLETLQRLLDMLNNGVVPAVPQKGSLGASGDLSPLSHMVLPLIGLGEAYYDGQLMSGEEAMASAGISPITLEAKEGLALNNGTQAMTAIGALNLYDSINLIKLADISASLTMEALRGVKNAFDPALHKLRPHPGQINTAANLLQILQGSERVVEQNTRNNVKGRPHVQDAYSLRCVPQIHGASRDAISYALDKVNIEINSVTDNPIIFPDMDTAISGGNFHGQPMAFAFDFLGIALSEIANVSERRIERLVNPDLSDGLSAFLTKDAGLRSGFMIPQYTAASLVSENKILAHPASVDSIPSCANQEDHVSMGTTAARKSREIYYNTSQVLAIELFTAVQAVDLRKDDNGKTLGKGTKAAYDCIRNVVPIVEEDRELYRDFEKIADLIDKNKIVETVQRAVGVLK